ncbi:hypothetical protein WEI85_36095 [Actinomycetes bacterium KLBMP 9797]
MTTMAEAPARTLPRWLPRGVLAGAAIVGVVVALDGRLPAAGAVLAVAGAADLRWVAVAVLAQLASQAMFAYQQRALLSAFGVGISPRRALAVTVSRSAISMALPAGSAVSAGYAFQQYRRRGATASVAVTVSVLSGIASIVGLVLLYAAYPLMARPWLAVLAAALLSPPAPSPSGAANRPRSPGLRRSAATTWPACASRIRRARSGRRRPAGRR